MPQFLPRAIRPILLLAALQVTMAAPALAQLPGYTFHTIAIPGSTTIAVTGINSAGTIVGYYRDASVHYRAFVLDGGTLTTVSYPGATHTYFQGISNTGIIAGSYSSGYQTPFSWQNGTFTPFSLPPNSGSPGGIDNAGVIVGGYTDTQAQNHGFRHNGAGSTPIDYPGALHSSLVDRNNVGVEIGNYWGFGSGRWRGYTLQGSTFAPIDMPGAYWTYLEGINDGGWIVGQQVDQSGAVRSAIVYDGSAFWPLAVPGATGWSSASAINGDGVIVGYYQGTYGGAYGQYGFVATPIVCQPDLGYGSPGGGVLTACGEGLAAGHSIDITLANAPPNTAAWIAFSTAFQPTPLLGGIVVTYPAFLVVGVVTDPSGTVTLPGLPGGGGPFSLYCQSAYLDATLPASVGLANALRLDFLQ